jgi:hypothetical protein
MFYEQPLISVLEDIVLIIITAKQAQTDSIA